VSVRLTGLNTKEGAQGTYSASFPGSLPQTGTFRAGNSLLTIGSFFRLTPAGATPKNGDFYLINSVRRSVFTKRIVRMKVAHYWQPGDPGQPNTDAYILSRVGL